MVAENLVARLLSEIRTMRWMLGLLLALVIALLGLFVAQAFPERPAPVAANGRAVPPDAAEPPPGGRPCKVGGRWGADVIKVVRRSTSRVVVLDSSYHCQEAGRLSLPERRPRRLLEAS